MARSEQAASISNPVVERLLNAEVLICGGTGGVGKTTVSASLGIAAARQGKRVLVLTVDPARRLASALGLDRLDQPRVRIDSELPGELWISMLRPQWIFDHFIDQAEVSQAQKQRLRDNRLFRQLMTTLSGSQEFTSLIWLQQLYASGEYDLIVLDTPPADHAVDFLYAPQRIAELFEGSVARFFSGKIKRLGLFNRLLVGSTQLWLKTLSKLTGAEFVEAVSDFVSAIGPFSELIANRSRAAQALLRQASTQFCLVASPDPVKLGQGQAFCQDLQAAGYHPQGLVINRAYPQWFSDWAASGGERPQSILQQQMADYFSRRIEQVRQSSLVRSQAEQVLELPELVGSLAGVAELEVLADYLQGDKQGGSDV